MTASAFVQHLDRRVLLFDGAMGTAIHGYDLDVEADYLGCENCTDVLVRSRPDVIGAIHDAYLAAGADCVETDSFGAMPHVLREFDIADQARSLARRSAEIARASCDRHASADKPRFVVGSMGPGTKLVSLGQIGYDELAASYRECALGLVEGGADAILCETCQDPLQIKAALSGAAAALETLGRDPEGVPLLVNVTIEQTGTMLVGTAIEAVATALRSYPIVSLGLNCATGPVEMTEHLRFLSRHWPRHVAVLPNAGLPVLVEGRTEYPLQPGPFAETMARFIDELGVSIVGGCCGTTPEHIARLAPLVEGRARAGPEKRAWRRGSSSLFSHVDHRQDNSFLIVGERCNASGSRKFKRLLEAEDWDSIVSLAREQVRDGSHLLDVNVDYAGRDNAEDMREVVSRLTRQVDAPLMLDSTQPDTIEAGLRCAGGRCVINSANFEDGVEKFDRICALAARYGAALVIGSIDEDRAAAMARTAERKHAIARRAYDRAVGVHGLDPADLFFDPLVLPISTGMDDDRRSALELVEGVRRIRADMPEAQITCGLSNVSFGLSPAARVVLNSMLLHELVDAGLTSAIVHASKILPLNQIDAEHRQAALDLIYDRRHPSKGGTGLPEGRSGPDFDPLQSLIDLFADVASVADTRPRLEDLPLEERLQRHIIDGEKEGLERTLDEALGRYAPLDIVNDHLLAGMKVVGELFGAGQMQLPFVLQSAEVMKKAVARLEPHMERVEGQSKGSIVLATVKGDVHDIGKNLVDIILTNNGYTVHNLGIKQPIADILRVWRETGADAIGLSGLLVKSVNVMEEDLRTLNEQGVDVPVILGGAALSRSYAEGHLRGVYAGPLLYGKDAFEGLRLMDHISAGRLASIVAEIDERQASRSEAKRAHDERRSEGRGPGSGGAGTSTLVRSEVARDNVVPEPPFWGSRVVEDVDLAGVFPFINPNALFSVQWQLKRGTRSKAEHEAMLDEVARPVFETLKRRCVDEGTLTPRVVYGWFPVSSEGDDLVVFDPGDHDRAVERFTFPRQRQHRRLCISDFFRDRDECRALGRRDVLGLSCVTVGPRVSEVAGELFASDRYQDYLYLHGLGVETAEALAELWHKRMRQELGLGAEDSPRMAELFQQKYRGSRYSFGYPACPDMSDQDTLWRLIDPTRIGCRLTENWQIDPEQSTSAIIVHHPQAKYFNA